MTGLLYVVSLYMKGIPMPHCREECHVLLPSVCSADADSRVISFSHTVLNVKQAIGTITTLDETPPSFTRLEIQEFQHCQPHFQIHRASIPTSVIDAPEETSLLLLCSGAWTVLDVGYQGRHDRSNRALSD